MKKNDEQFHFWIKVTNNYCKNMQLLIVGFNELALVVFYISKLAIHGY